MAQTEAQRGALEDRYFDNMLNSHLDGNGPSERQVEVAIEDATAYVLGRKENIEDVFADGNGDDVYELLALILKTQKESPRNKKEMNCERLDRMVELFESKLKTTIDDRAEYELEASYDN